MFKNGSESSKGVSVPGYLQDTDDIREDLAQFQATIKFFDERVGEILDALEASEIASNTLVVMTSDHGIPYPGAKWTARKAGIEVPFIVYQPDTVFTGGNVFDEVMGNVDVLPTILDYLDADIPTNIQGVSFMSLINGETRVPPRTEAFAQYTPEMKRDNQSRCIINNKYHLIRYFDAGRIVDYPVAVNPQTFANHVQRCKTTEDRPFAQLYDIEKDPYELNDIGSLEENREIVAELSEKLLDWMKDLNDPLLKGPLRTPYYERAMADLLEGG